MLVKDPTKRLSANEALLHPWFQQNEEIGESNLNIKEGFDDKDGDGDGDVHPGEEEAKLKMPETQFTPEQYKLLTATPIYV